MTKEETQALFPDLTIVEFLLTMKRNGEDHEVWKALSPDGRKWTVGTCNGKATGSKSPLFDGCF